MTRLMLTVLGIVASSCSPQGESSLSSTIWERDRDKDGEIDERIETTFRNGARILDTTTIRNDSGNWVTSSRAYSVGGKLVLIESDEDGDGEMETMVLLGAGTNELEVFKRHGGVPMPVDKRILETYQRQLGAMRKLVESMGSATNNVDRTASFEQTGEIIREAYEERKKIIYGPR